MSTSLIKFDETHRNGSFASSVSLLEAGGRGRLKNILQFGLVVLLRQSALLFDLLHLFPHYVDI